MLLTKSLLVGIGLLLLSSTTRAQAPLPRPPVPPSAAMDSEYFSGRPAEALAGYDALLTRDSTDVEVLWRASRAALALGFLAERQDSDNPMY
ncbi:MAG: hypothetical protein ABJE47_25895, partial [bacterium]